MILRARHRTLFRYSTPSVDSHNEVRLQPLSDEFQKCLAFRLTTDPPAKIFAHQELGGWVHYFGMRGSHRYLEILAESEVETCEVDPTEGVDWITDDWSDYADDEFRQRYVEFLVASPFVTFNSDVNEMASELRSRTEGSVAKFLLALNKKIFREFEYDSDVTHVHTTVDEVMKLRAGVCQDFAHLMIACCRSQGIPARYVSGYLNGFSDDPLIGSEAMHAWVECPLPDGRWLSLDPTNNILANDQYIRVHVGRDYSEVSPTKGLYLGTPAESLEVTLDVRKVNYAAQD